MKPIAILFLGILVTLPLGCSRKQGDVTLVKVEVQRVELTGTAKAMALTGEIRAQMESELGFRTDGRITERLVDVGDHVSPGQVLAKLDPQEQQAAVDAAESDVRAAEAKLANETSNLARHKRLLALKADPPSEYDRAEEWYRTAQSALKAANARLGTAHDALAQTELRASNAGTITSRKAEIGQVVSAGQPVFVLAHDGARDAVFNVHESVFGQQPIDRNVPVQIKLVADPSVHTTGKVREVTPTLSGAGGTLAIKIGLEVSPSAMTLGAAVMGEAPRPLDPLEAISIPPGSIASATGQPSVWIVDPATGAVSARPITIARYETDRVIVATGLRAGDLVVTSNAQKMCPKQRVAIAEEHQP
ncbi:MAG: efflux RND transporter periplasmic adaptor subunit [Acidobacteriaceae bacterium]|nr:efflux RND transporter periplasmic adaptor subunit [Acidobacteriaceae bacterium]